MEGEVEGGVTELIMMAGGGKAWVLQSMRGAVDVVTICVLWLVSVVNEVLRSSRSRYSGASGFESRLPRAR